MQYLSADKEGKEHLGKSAGFNDEKKNLTQKGKLRYIRTGVVFVSLTS